MTFFKKIMTVSVIALLLGGCANSIKPFSEDELISFTRDTCTLYGRATPDWHCAPPQMFPADAYFQRGIANSSINDLATQFDVANENAKAALVTKVVSNISREYMEERVSSGQVSSQQFEISYNILTKNISTLTLPYAETIFHFHDIKGNLHVLIRVDRSALNNKIKEKEDKAKREFEKQLKS